MSRESLPAPDLFPATPREGKPTPMMAQYLRIREENPDGLLFYRMGDFYELFFEDAALASEALGIALTKRGQHLGKDIPMCGVPVHSAESYLERLIKKGFRVIICEQMEGSSPSWKKTLMPREVARVVTAGTLTEETLLSSRAHNHLVALAPPAAASKEGEALWGLAAADISTGDFRARLLGLEDIAAEMARLAPSEILMPASLEEDPPEPLRPLLRSGVWTAQPQSAFSAKTAPRRLLEALGPAAHAVSRDMPPAALAACAALASYVRVTQRGDAAPLQAPSLEEEGAIMMIDAATRSHLEITRTLSGTRKGSLLWAMDRSVTGAGSRELAERLSAPLTDVAAIEGRQDEVAFFHERAELLDEARRILRGAPDLLRAQKRLAFGRGSPRDLGAIRDALHAARSLARALTETIEEEETAPPFLERYLADLRAPSSDLLGALASALVAEPPPSLRDGGYIAAGHDPALDAKRDKGREAKRLIGRLQTRYIGETGVRQLKIKENNLLGYYVEAPSSAARPLLAPPHSETFIHRQSLANQTRFTTEALREAAQEIEEAGGRALSHERRIFDDLVKALFGEDGALRRAARAMAALDVAAGLALLASERGMTRPLMTAAADFAIEGGRHPVVEGALAARGDAPFMANDCHLERKDGAAPLWLLTGPNMAGKSTFLRQNALIVIMAQMGSFVPARGARLGIVDRLFSRVGASDNLAGGQSTFMVEMTEMAAILHRATAKSLVIVDELGRGTATFDGLSIAWAVIEHLHEKIGCRGLFATHFHELTALEGHLGGLVNRTMRVEIHEGRPIFLHDVAAGAAGASYGIKVAEGAGFPSDLLARAETLLALLERDGAAALPRPDASAAEEVLLRERKEREERARARKILEALSDTDPDSLTPRESLDRLYRLKAIADE